MSSSLRPAQAICEGLLRGVEQTAGEMTANDVFSVWSALAALAVRPPDSASTPLLQATQTRAGDMTREQVSDVIYSLRCLRITAPPELSAARPQASPAAYAATRAEPSPLPPSQSTSSKAPNTSSDKAPHPSKSTATDPSSLAPTAPTRLLVDNAQVALDSKVRFSF